MLYVVLFVLDALRFTLGAVILLGFLWIIITLFYWMVRNFLQAIWPQARHARRRTSRSTN